jgi:hypothetical protein
MGGGRRPDETPGPAGTRTMKIRSMAGEFEISISSFDVEDDHLVMVGVMGVWEARTYMTPREMVGLLLKTLTPKVLWFLLKLPFLLVRAPRPLPSR